MKLHTLAAAIVMAFAPLAHAATATTSIVEEPVTQLNTAGENKGQTQVATKIAASFGKLAGSDANTLKLVQALRDGTAVKLTTTTTKPSPINTPTTGPVTAPGSSPAPAPGTGTTTTTTITPPTGKMGWGNVFISLALAKDQLARVGITDPTTAQLQAALTGGDVVGADGKTVALKGILQMRADGMGWGQIAQASGTKLGPVVSSIKSAHTKVAALPASGTTATTTTTTAVTPKAKGVVTAGGSSASGVTHGNSSNAGGKGVVTAAGGSAAGVTHGNSGNASGKGVVNAGGGNASGVTSAAGNSGGQGKGNAGGNGNGKGKGGG